MIEWAPHLSPLNKEQDLWDLRTAMGWERRPNQYFEGDHIISHRVDEKHGDVYVYWSPWDAQSFFQIFSCLDLYQYDITQGVTYYLLHNNSKEMALKNSYLDIALGIVRQK